MRSRNCIWQNRMLTTAQCEMGNCIVALDCGKIEIESWNCVCSEVRWSFTGSSNFSQAKEPPAPQQRQPRGLTAWLGYRLLHINASVMWQFVWKAVQTRGTHTHKVPTFLLLLHSLASQKCPMGPQSLITCGGSRERGMITHQTHVSRCNSTKERTWFALRSFVPSCVREHLNFSVKFG